MCPPPPWALGFMGLTGKPPKISSLFVQLFSPRHSVIISLKLFNNFKSYSCFPVYAGSADSSGSSLLIPLAVVAALFVLVLLILLCVLWKDRKNLFLNEGL